MLRVVKSDPNQGIRKTAKGHLLLSRKPEHSAEALHETVGKALGDRVVKTLTESAQIEIRDLDELASKEEILGAIRVELKDSSLPIEAIKSLRPAFGGQQKAF
ncbi:hypothetical protein AWZ03_015118, partial [Drosophila navojoa]